MNELEKAIENLKSEGYSSSDIKKAFNELIKETATKGNLSEKSVD
jgi:hypothetical protein